jgi:hypothetical protein
MKHPPETQVPIVQLAKSPSHIRVQPPPQLSMLQVLFMVQVLMWHPPPVQSCTRQVASSPMQSRSQPPEQLVSVQFLPLQSGSEQPPVSVQSTVQLAPVSQLV